MHQFVNQDVVPYERRHEDQPPVQTNVTIPPARPPARSLVANGDTRHLQAVPRRQFQQPLRQIVARLLLQCAVVVHLTQPDPRPVPLLRDPLRIPLHECLGLAS